MSAAFDNLLTATIEHLNELKGNGRKFVCLSPGTLQALRPSKKASAPLPPPAPAAVSTRTETTSAFASLKSSLGRPPATAPQILKPQMRAPSPAPVAMPAVQAGSIEDLRKSVLACVKCPHLVASRKNVVFGVGNLKAKLMFVGEAPGADEDVQGEPFVGKAGQLLTRIINTMGLSRQDVYIANILKCRPDTPGQAYGNRKPTVEEMKTCIPWLERQIDLIQPQVMVALGATAVEGLLGHCPGITKMRGSWQAYRNIPLMPTFHPSYLLRDERLQDKRKVWEDMLQVMEKLGMPISERQRTYFMQSA
jgi:uracil-DNA glycosylase